MAAAETQQYLTFETAGERFAVGVLGVREIIEWDTVTSVPTAPRWVKGVINLRGAVVPVVDLACKFGLSDSVVTKRTCIVIVEVAVAGARAVMGVLADAVNQVIDLAPSDIEPLPPFGAPTEDKYLLGMGRVDKKLVLLLDVARTLGGDLGRETAEAAPPASPPPAPGAASGAGTLPADAGAAAAPRG